jgi:hypothetical protein
MDIGLVVLYYLLMHRDMQQTPRVRAFADRRWVKCQ